jgi:hypothetical protein
MMPVKSLQAPPRTQQAPTLTTRGGYQVSTPAGTDDVVVQLNNVEVLRITVGANMTIKTKGTLTLDANNIELRSTSLDVRASLNATLKTGNDLALSAGRSVTVNGNAVGVNSTRESGLGLVGAASKSGSSGSSGSSAPDSWSR